MIAAGLFLLLPWYGSGKSADFLILENPASLEILSRYEQSLTPAERKEILPFAPVKVVGEKSVLGDGITPVMEVDFEGKAFYLPRRGWTENPPAARRHRGCRVEVGEVKRAGADMPCTRGAAPGGASAPLRAGETLRAVFTCGTRTYVKKTGAEGGYLWCPAGGPYAAKVEAPATAETGPGPDLQAQSALSALSTLSARLEARFDAANATYASFTRAFNKMTGESRTPPRWDCTLAKGGMRCRLEGGLGSDDLEKSTAVLVDELRKSLTGKSFDVAASPGGIEVSPRAEKSPRP